MSEEDFKLKAYEEGSATLRHYSDLVWKVRATGIGFAVAAVSGSAVLESNEQALAGFLVAIAGTAIAVCLSVMDHLYARHFDGVLRGLKSLDVDGGPWMCLELDLPARYRLVRYLIPVLMATAAILLGAQVFLA